MQPTDSKNVCSTKNETAENPPKRTNMAFFVTIIRNLRLNYKRLSELTGVSQQLISFWIMTDDAKLSRMTDIFDKLGIELKCSYVPSPGSSLITKGTGFSIEIDNVPEFSRQETERNEVIGKILRSDAKLKFLAELIDRSSSGLVQFCKDMGYHYFTVYQWFMKDDMKISKICEIAEKTNQTVNWKITKKNV